MKSNLSICAINKKLQILLILLIEWAKLQNNAGVINFSIDRATCATPPPPSLICCHPLTTYQKISKLKGLCVQFVIIAIENKLGISYYFIVVFICLFNFFSVLQTKIYVRYIIYKYLLPQLTLAIFGNRFDSCFFFFYCGFVPSP